MSSWQCPNCCLYNSMTRNQCQACFARNSNTDDKTSLPPYELNWKLPNSELLDLIIKTSIIGKQTGYLKSFESEQKIIRDNDTSFLVKLALNLSKKPKPKINGKSNKTVFKDPFMPPFELGSLVCDLDDEYRLILNKYNVVDNHVLIITSKFVSQDLPLNVDDFKIAMNVVQSMDGLCYLNCGAMSGASQPHKHLQIIPRNHQFPIETFVKNITSIQNADEEKNNDINLCTLKEYAFIHSVYIIDQKNINADTLYKAYNSMTHEIKTKMDHNEKDTFDYNMIMTTDYIFIVPRKKDSYQDVEKFGAGLNIGINAVTFAGTFFCKSQDSLSMLEQVGPFKVLQHVTFK